MVTFFLCVIFLAFISLGLPDSGMGVMWPYMRLDFGANVSLAGLITITVTVMSSISSVVCIRLSRKVNVGTITAVSSMLTAVGMLGYSISGAFWQVCVFAMLTGFGGGGVDATLNDYVAKHYSSRIMNWLHSCWGLGAMLSPIIMTGALNASGSWRSGFLIVGIAQATMAIMFFFTSKFWKKESKVAEKEELSPLAPQMTMKNLAPWLSILCFFLYCGIEMINGVWLKTLLYETRELGTNLSSAAVSVFFGAIMVGRIIIGLFSNKLGNRNAIRIGICVAMLGFVLLTIKSTILCLCAALFIGLGLAPIYPALMHETALRFNKKTAGNTIGLQMAAANLGILVIPVAFGFIAEKTSFEIMPYVAGVILLVLIVVSEKLNSLTKRQL